MYSKTIAGVEMNWWNLDPSIVTIEHIGNVLARINRYAGHWIRPISVARHCLTMTDKLRDAFASPMVQLQGLFHDAAEAYTQDIPSPLKSELYIADTDGEPMPYGDFEDDLTRRIFEHLNIAWPIPRVVWDADRAEYHSELPILRGEVHPSQSTDPEVVAGLFIARARILFTQAIPNYGVEAGTLR